MKRHLQLLLILTILSLFSCQKPVKVFEIDSDVQHKTLKLYNDSTFIEEIEEVEDNYQYSGNWTGDLEEGKNFKTIATRKGNQIITLTPVHEYKVVNGQAVEISENRKYIKEI